MDIEKALTLSLDDIYFLALGREIVKMIKEVNDAKTSKENAIAYGRRKFVCTNGAPVEMILISEPSLVDLFERIVAASSYSDIEPGMDPTLN